MIVVWFPTVVFGNLLARDFKQKDWWKAVLRDCPSWARRLLYVVGGYAVVNFVRMLLARKGASDGVSSADASWVWTGHLLVFYAMAFAILSSATRWVGGATEATCPQGHAVSVFAKFCDQCGATVTPKSPA